MNYTPIPSDELALFNALDDIQVVFDIGARTDTDYVHLKPGIELHAFEPNPIFFQELKDKIGDRPHTYLNNYGLGDKSGMFAYSNALQMFEGGEGGESDAIREDQRLEIRLLDGYCAEKGITRIDFLKIDTEGYDYQVLKGGEKAIKMSRYIQYEHWNDRLQFHDLLENDFYMTYIGGRNVFCQRKYPLV